MFRSFTRLICLIVSFQLAVSCGNSSQVSVTGATKDGFRILGTVVKTFERINDMVFPSAMAQIESGIITVSDYTDPANVSVIASQKLYDGKNTFDFTVPTDKVEGKVIRVTYTNSELDDQRQKFESTREYMASGKMDMILDTEGSFQAALIKEEIDALTTATPAIVQALVENFDSEAELKLLSKGKANIRDIFNSPFLAPRVAANLLELKNKEISTDEFERRLETLKEEEKTKDFTGGRLVCTAKISVEETSKFEGKIIFSTLDKNTKAAFGDSVDLGGARSAAEGISALTKFYETVNKTVKEKGLTFIGTLTLTDNTNKLSSNCPITVAPKSPEASTAAFDKFDASKLKNLDDAVVDLDKKYAETIVLLDKAYEAAKIDLNSKTGKALYFAQVEVIDSWYEDYLKEAEGMF